MWWLEQGQLYLNNEEIGDSGHLAFKAIELLETSVYSGLTMYTPCSCKPLRSFSVACSWMSFLPETPIQEPGLRFLCYPQFQWLLPLLHFSTILHFDPRPVVTCCLKYLKKLLIFWPKLRSFFLPGLTVEESYSFRIGGLFWTLFGKGQDPQVSSHSHSFPVFILGWALLLLPSSCFPCVSHRPAHLPWCPGGGIPPQGQVSPSQVHWTVFPLMLQDSLHLPLETHSSFPFLQSTFLGPCSLPFPLPWAW